MRAALQVFDYMRLTPDGYGLMHHGMDYAIEHELIRNQQSTPSDERFPHFPVYPFYRFSYMYQVVNGEYQAKLLDYLSEKERRAWARLPEFWWVSNNETMKQAAEEVGPRINELMWDGFVNAIIGENGHACSDLQQALRDNEDLKRAWEETQEGGRVEDLSLIELDQGTWLGGE